MAIPLVRARSTGLLGPTAAVLALGSAGVHLALLDGASTASLAMAVMALVCLPCAWHLWRGPTTGVWALTAAVDGGMLAVHAQMVATMSSAAAQPVTMPGMAGSDATSTWLVRLGLILVGTQLATAALATVPPLFRREQAETGRSSDTPRVHRTGNPAAEHR